jgi:Holliday junction resolvase RusA-like endonuclease
MKIQFTIPGVPVAQPRQRHRVIQSAGRAFATNYTPAKHPVNAWKAVARIAAMQAYDGPVLDEPLILTAIMVFPRPANRIWKSKPMPREPKTGKPDLDNCAKAFDALTGQVWRDDALIFRAVLEKWIASGDEQPHTEVTIETFSDSHQ